MKNKRYLFFALIFLVCILSISAVNAAEDLAIDSDANDVQDIVLEDSISEDVSTTDNQELVSEEKTDTEKTQIAESQNQNLEASSDAKVLDSANDSAKTKVETKKLTQKAKTTKINSKKTSTFKTIKRGSKNKAMVKKIQRALKKNGYYRRYKGHYLKIDGKYSTFTVRAVKQFQKAKKLKVTGKVDEKTAIKLKIYKKKTKAKKKINAEILFKEYDTFVKEYNSGYSFEAKIVRKSTGKGLSSLLNVDYLKDGKLYRSEAYYTGKDGINYITPDDLEVGSYIAEVSPDDSRVKAKTVTRKIIIKKTSIKIKAKSASVDSNNNIQLKATLRFKNNAEVREGKVKFTIDGKSYIVNVKNGQAVKSLKLSSIKSKQYTVEFLGTKNINAGSVKGKID